MPQQEWAYLTDPVAYWAAVGTDNYGNVLVASPVQLRVKWNMKRTEKLDPKGNTVQLDGTAMVTFDVPIGSRMQYGTLADLVGTGTNVVAPDPEVYEVKTFSRDVDMKGRISTRTVGLMRYKGTPS